MSLYMPSAVKDDDHFSFVDMFLEGKGKFKYLFQREEEDDKLYIPEFLHLWKYVTKLNGHS